MSKKINRRKFFTDTSLSAAGIMLGSNLVGCASKGESDISSYDIMKDVMKYRKIDAHCHPESDLRKQIDTTIPEDMMDAARRYPEAMFQFAHIGGGGDWEYECKSFRNYPNIYVDTSGSNNEENMIDFAIRCLGEDRIFFGTDNCYHIKQRRSSCCLILMHMLDTGRLSS